MAQLGTFVFGFEEGPEPGSDSGWNRDLKLQRSSPLGSIKDSLLLLAAGSSVRTLTCGMTLARFNTLKALQGTVVTFVDWVEDSRSCYVLTVRRESGSRPFWIRARLELIEQ